MAYAISAGSRDAVFAQPPGDGPVSVAGMTLLRPSTLVLFLALCTGGGLVLQVRADPEQVLRDRFQLSADEIAQARAGQPVAKLLASGSRDELAVLGAVRLPGDKARLAGWIKNIEAFRRAAELGTAYVVPSPPTSAAFANLSLDSKDLAELQRCRPGKCDIRLSPESMARIQRDVKWGTSEAAGQANTIVRDMLAGYAAAYATSGRAGIDALAAASSTRSFAADNRGLFAQATTLSALSPALVSYLEHFPAGAPPGATQCLYWSAMPVEGVTLVSLHSLVVFQQTSGETMVADEILYGSRYFDAGAVVISLSDTAAGGGYYAIAGSRLKASQLGGAAGVVLRRQIERAALDSIRTYLEWMRDSLSL